jgi:eukaryotic-like serine/threonine-protein kinase
MAIQIWQPGDKIKDGRFEIIEKLKVGGFGIIYLAEDKKKNERVVIKTLNAHLQNQPNFKEEQEKFIDEGIKHRGFKHPHIVKIYERIRIGELSGFSMEYIPGQDLYNYVKEHGRLREEIALLYIDQIAQALDSIHQESTIHRDVHPGNIMKRQDLDRTVLIDFGIAKEFFDQTFSVSNNHGMEFYKPIEQYEKSGRFGAYTDIYSLSATLYYLLAGVTLGYSANGCKSIMRKNFRDRGEGESIERVLWGAFVDIGVSEKTQAAIKAGMGIEPSERPQSITEFRTLLGLVKEK